MLKQFKYNNLLIYEELERKLETPKCTNQKHKGKLRN